MTEPNADEQNETRDTGSRGIDDGRPVKRRSLFTRRNILVALSLSGIGLILAGLFSVGLYRYGVFDRYVKDQFVETMNEIGVDFTADVFSLTASPFELELKNATFNNRATGEKLFFVRDAKLTFSILDLFSWQLSRSISIDTTEINGVEVWVTFDENGRSNFSDITLIEDEPGARITFKYQSMRFILRDGTVHYGDLSRTLAGTANNVLFSLEPVDISVPDEEKRYRLELVSTGSRFVYDGSPLEQIDIRGSGIADRKGAEITALTIRTPIGESVFEGTLTDWASLSYDLRVESTVDLTQTSNIFPMGATLRGVGNFVGRVSGAGENYRVEGKVISDTLSADGVYLRGVNVAATVEGTNRSYSANGTAIAELLTFEDFRIEFPRLSGNVRGTGSDFRWFGELQAAAAKAGDLSIMGLFLADASAELRDKEIFATARDGRAGRFSIADMEFGNLIARDLRFSRSGDVTTIGAPGARADSFEIENIGIRRLESGSVRVVDRPDSTTVEVDDLRANAADVAGGRASEVRASELRLNRLGNTTNMTLRNLSANRYDVEGARIDRLNADIVTLQDVGPETTIYSDSTRIARMEAGGAVLGDLNIAGVRMTIRQGRVEVRSDDIDAGDVVLASSSVLADGGKLEKVAIARPVFVLEPSGRYRASADMSLGGGVLGSIPLGSANAQVIVSNNLVQIDNLAAEVMDGQLTGSAEIGFSNSVRSRIDTRFSGVDLSKLVALQAGRVVALDGVADGEVALTMSGTDTTTTSGTVRTTITANAGNDESGRIPVNGRIELAATEGVFSIDEARLRTDASELTAAGRFSLRDETSDLDLSLRSSDAAEIDRLVRILNVAPEITDQVDALRIRPSGDLAFVGRLTGNMSDPVFDGRASVATVSIRDRIVGGVTTELTISPLATEFRNGRLTESSGGTVDFEVFIPAIGTNNISLRAQLSNVNAGNLIAAIPVDLPERLRDFEGGTSGTVNISGIPNEAQGELSITTKEGSVAGQPFDEFRADLIFTGTLVEVKEAEMRASGGRLIAQGTYDRTSTSFDFELNGSDVPLPLAVSLIPESSVMPTVLGKADLSARVTGIADRTQTYNVDFSGSASDVVVNDNPFGTLSFKGTTVNEVLRAEMTAILEGRPQTFFARVDFSREEMPFRVEHELDQSPLRPFFSLIPQLRGISIAGTGTGRVEFGGDLTQIDDKGNRTLSAAGLSGSARFSQFSLLIQDTPLIATEPVVVAFSPREITFESVRFAGSGSNVTVAGTKALTDLGVNDLSIDGRLNLGLLNVFPGFVGADTFLGGFAEVGIRLSGVNRTARLSGTAVLENANLATFVGPSRLTVERLQGRVLFTSNQAQIETLSGYLGGGRFSATGGALIGDDLQLNSYRLSLTGANITVPLPENFITTGDARLDISGRRIGGDLATLVSGSILARRSIYSRDIDLANVVGARREGALSGGATGGIPTRFDLTITGRDALVIRNNIADLTASAVLRLTGTSANPQLSGRITANSGTVFFRRDRYVVQRGVLEFPPDTEIDPILFLQAETEIQGYQIFVNLSGQLTDTEQLNASVRSSPALPQADVISLITTGSLANTESGIPTLASTGINTAAEILTDSIISNPARRATDRLFGLNVFEIDPIISGERINPSARLTVGRQINNNLRVTYATNLSQDQNQVLAVEYRVSNRLSVVAQYEQRSLSNVTRDRDNFSFEVRFRRRF